MKKDQRYVITKPIPIGKDKFIPVNTDIYRMHGFYYMNGTLLTSDYQEDFDALIEREEKTGWEYIVPVNSRTMFRNDKEDL